MQGVAVGAHQRYFVRRSLRAPGERSSRERRHGKHNHQLHEDGLFFRYISPQLAPLYQFERHVDIHKSAHGHDQHERMKHIFKPQVSQ